MTNNDRTHNAANELQGIATHDANGNMILMPGLKGKYDAWNRLVEVRDSSDVLIANYEYNGLNQRVKKTVDNIVTKSYFNERWQELESTTGSELTAYVWGLRYVDDLVLREKGEERLYSLADPNWNVVALADTSGSAVERMKYDAFGKISWIAPDFSARNDSQFDWNRTFTGQVLDSETGLMLYRNRYYHTGVGRFVSRDPIGYEGKDENLYRYVRGNSTQYTDANGLLPSTVIGGMAGCGVGALTGGGISLIKNYVKCSLSKNCNHGVNACKAGFDALGGCLAGGVIGVLVGSGNVVGGTQQASCIASAITGAFGAIGSFACNPDSCKNENLPNTICNAVMNAAGSAAACVLAGAGVAEIITSAISPHVTDFTGGALCDLFMPTTTMNQ